MRAAFLGLIAAMVAAACQPGEKNTYSQTPCPRELQATGRQVECGEISVPENYEASGGRRVVLPVVIVKAANAAGPLPPVFYLHGGPGGGVIADLPQALTTPQGLELIGEKRDWIFFDQRGSGGARPRLGCGGVALTDAGPASDAAVGQLQACLRDFVGAGVDLAHYNSLDVVHDIQSIRHALAIDTYDVYALSYGTRIAFDLIVHAPAGVRAMVLDSPWPMEASWTEPGPGWVSAAFRDVMEICDRDARCIQRYPDLRARFDTTLTTWLARARTEPDIRDRVGRLALWMIESLYDGEGVRKMPAALKQIVEGDLSVLGGADLLAGSGYAEAAHIAFLCNEELPFESSAAARALSAGDPLAEAVAQTMANYFDVCKAMAGAAPDQVENAPVSSDVRVMFLAAGIDPGCPADLSLSAVKRFGRGYLGIAPYSTHGVASNSACARRLVQAFLDNPAAAPDGSCLEGDPAKPVFE